MSRFDNPEWQRKNSLRVDLNYMLSEHLGSPQGISLQELEEFRPRMTEAVRSLRGKRQELTWRDLPYNQTEVTKQILAYADKARNRFRNFVVLGIGGSALGPLAVHHALNHPYYNELSPEQRKGLPRFYAVDNVDPERFAGLLEVINPEETLFNVITKSGSTSETMAQLMIVFALLKERLGSGYNEHIVATTDLEKGNLVKIAKEEGYQLFYVPEGVGGRFSELCPVGLLPAAMTGLDIEEMLAGAAFMDKWIEGDESNPALLRAALHYLALQRGKNISVMMPYAEKLKYVADWYAQLWAESLGKRFDLQHKEVFVGQTPVKALGVTDQHSQVQLYTEGPFDKVINFLAVDKFSEEQAIPAVFTDMPNVAFLGGSTLGQLMESERRATEFAMFKARRMNNTVYLPQVNAFTIGQLLYMLEVETAFMGEFLNIDAFDQPGVEEGKNATYALMGRPGFEAKGEELNSAAAKEKKFILDRS